MDNANWRQRYFGHPLARVFILRERLSVHYPIKGLEAFFEAHYAARSPEKRINEPPTA